MPTFFQVELDRVRESLTREPDEPRERVLIDVPITDPNWMPTGYRTAPPGSYVPIPGISLPSHKLAFDQNHRRLEIRKSDGLVYQWSVVVRKAAKNCIFKVNIPRGFRPETEFDFPPGIEVVTMTCDDLRKFLFERNLRNYLKGIWTIEIIRINLQLQEDGETTTDSPTAVEQEANLPLASTDSEQETNSSLAPADDDDDENRVIGSGSFLICTSCGIVRQTA